MSGPDADDMVQQDVQKVRKGIKQYRQNDGFSASVAKLLEGTFWALCVGSVAAMLIALPWVGEGKAVSGEMWIGLGCAGIVLFGLCAGLVRLASTAFEDADRAMGDRFERGR